MSLITVTVNKCTANITVVIIYNEDNFKKACRLRK